MAIFTLGQITQNRPGARESVTNGPSRSEPTRAIGPIVGEIVVNVQCWCHLLESKCWGKGKTDVAGRYRKTLPGSAEGFDYMETLYSNSYRRSPWINLSTLVWITFHGRNIGAQHNLLTGGPWCFHFAIQFLKKKVAPFHFTLYVLSYILYTKAGVQHDGLFLKKEKKNYYVAAELRENDPVTWWVLNGRYIAWPAGGAWKKEKSHQRRHYAVSVAQVVATLCGFLFKAGRKKKQPDGFFGIKIQGIFIWVGFSDSKSPNGFARHPDGYWIRLFTRSLSRWAQIELGSVSFISWIVGAMMRGERCHGWYRSTHFNDAVPLHEKHIKEKESPTIPFNPKLYEFLFESKKNHKLYQIDLNIFLFLKKKRYTVQLGSWLSGISRYI